MANPESASERRFDDEEPPLTFEERNELSIPPEIRREDYTDEEWTERTSFWREGWHIRED